MIDVPSWGELQTSLDILVAAFIGESPGNGVRLPSKTTVLELMEWASEKARSKTATLGGGIEVKAWPCGHDHGAWIFHPSIKQFRCPFNNKLYDL